MKFFKNFIFFFFCILFAIGLFLLMIWLFENFIILGILLLVVIVAAIASGLSCIH